MCQQHNSGSDMQKHYYPYFIEMWWHKTNDADFSLSSFRFAVCIVPKFIYLHKCWARRVQRDACESECVCVCVQWKWFVFDHCCRHMTFLFCTIEIHIWPSMQKKRKVEKKRRGKWQKRRCKYNSLFLFGDLCIQWRKRGFFFFDKIYWYPLSWEVLDCVNFSWRVSKQGGVTKRGIHSHRKPNWSICLF